MDSERFLELLPCEFFTGVPDSLLSAFSAGVIRRYGEGKGHIIAANEGNAVGLAAGYHLATGKIPCVYLQNSGVGNIINPVTSLLSPLVYGIPCLFLVGWRGQPGKKDEPQHAFMGKSTRELLEAAGVVTFLLEKDLAEERVLELIQAAKQVLGGGDSAAILVEKGALTGEAYKPEKGEATLAREEAIACILSVSSQDPIFCTTGKASRELFELRERRGEGHENDFLTVGSMGHCSCIALGAALQKPERTHWCIDGDGAALMHLGALCTIGKSGAENLIHVVINNGAHESVGGQPTGADRLDLTDFAKAAGYAFTARADGQEGLMAALEQIKRAPKPAFLEICCAVGAREDLGRPTTTPSENKTLFMNRLRED